MTRPQQWAATKVEMAPRAKLYQSAQSAVQMFYAGSIEVSI